MPDSQLPELRNVGKHVPYSVRIICSGGGQGQGKGQYEGHEGNVTHTNRSRNIAS